MYPGTQYQDVACYTDDWPSLVQEIRASDKFTEGEDYIDIAEHDIEILKDTADFQRHGDQAFCILRLPVGGGTRLTSLVNLDQWRVVPVLDVHGEHLKPGGIYDLPPPKMAILNGWPGFQKNGFMGRVLV